MNKQFARAELKAASDGLVSFIASTASEDRMGDVIRQDGWDLKAYKKNPVVLFGHDHSKPIGKAHNIRVKDGALTADFEFASAEVDEFAAKIGRMVKAGYLNAVSVGFQPLEVKPRKNGGYEFLKSELLEISVVSVPANSEALAFAKSLGIDQSRVFAANDAVNLRKHEVFTRKHAVLMAKYG